MTDLKYLWENSTSAIFWGVVLAVLLTVIVFRIFKNTPTGSRYTEVSTFWGLLMTIMLSVEFISFIGAFQARMAVDDVEEAVKSYGANALNIINIDDVIENMAPSLKRFVKTENINKDAVNDVVSTYANSIRQSIDKQMIKLGVFILCTMIFLPMFIVKSKRFTGYEKNYSARRTNYRTSRKHY